MTTLDIAKEKFMIKEKSVKKNMKKVICLAFIALTTYCFISISQASEDKHHDTHKINNGLKLHLSKELKDILNQEMNEIQDGMMKIIPAISEGNWETIANIAIKIQNSFILKQKLTQKQIEELHGSLSEEFIEMDHGFHSTAGRLVHAAHQQDGELVNFYFYKLHSKCLKCHSKYASERFPNFKKAKNISHEHHNDHQ